MNTEQSRSRQVTGESYEVIDLSPSPSGDVVYTTLLPNSSTQVWLVDKTGRKRRSLLTCEQALCQQFVWHPDGRRLTYERRELDERSIPGGPRLWWLDSVTLETVPLIADRRSVSSGATFSADGIWISYVGSPDEGVFVRNLQDGRTISIPSSLGTPGVWSPDGSSIIVRRSELVVLHGEEGDDHEDHTHSFVDAVNLVLVSIPDREITPISGDKIADDSAAAWSPDGHWIAFGRRLPRTSMGKQLWLVRPDGSDDHALTDSPEYNHAIAGWSADGRSLLFQRFALTNEDAVPEIWISDISSGEMSLIASPGFRPAWQP